MIHSSIIIVYDYCAVLSGKLAMAITGKLARAIGRLAL